MRSSSTLTSFSTTTATLLEDRAYYALVAWSGNLYAIGGGVGDLTSGSSTTLTRTATVERIPFRTTGTSYAYNARNLYTVDFGSDVEILFADWSYLVGSTGTASLAWRVAPSSTGNAEAWNELGSSGYEVIDQVGRYLQLDVTLYCTDTGSVILEDLTLGYR
jgi:hypothetical protein